MSIIEVNTDSQTLSKIIDYLHSLKVNFTIKEDEESPYDPEFVEMILRSKQQAEEGKGRIIKIEDLWK
jgi:hypothetical protein